MRVLLVGGTGAFGARLLPLLHARGHSVTGLARSDAGAALLTRHGAQALTGDIFDPAALREGCRLCEAVIDLSTAEPRLPRPGGRDWSINHRIRSEGVRNLAAAAVDGGVTRYVHAGLGLVYGGHGAAWVDEGAELRTPPLLRSAFEGEAAVLAARRDQGLPAIVLRCGELYGPGFPATERIVELARRRLLPLSGRTDAYTSFLELGDAATGVLLALEAGAAAPPVVNLSDDEPAEVGEWLPALARALGAPPPWRLPRWAAALLESRELREQFAVSLRMSNRLAREALGFRPAAASFREGFALLAGGGPRG